jgi:hypothetical protein
MIEELVVLAFEQRYTSDSGSKFHALHTLRDTRSPP